MNIFWITIAISIIITLILPDNGNIRVLCCETVFLAVVYELFKRGQIVKNFSLGRVNRVLGKLGIIVRNINTYKRILNSDRIVIDELNNIIKEDPIVEFEVDRNVTDGKEMFLECLLQLQVEFCKLLPNKPFNDFDFLSIIYSARVAGPVVFGDYTTYEEFILQVTEKFTRSAKIDHKNIFTTTLNVSNPNAQITWGYIDNMEKFIGKGDENIIKYKKIQNDLGKQILVFYTPEKRFLGAMLMYYEFRTDVKEELATLKSYGYNITIHSRLPKTVCRVLANRLGFFGKNKSVLNWNNQGNSILYEKVPNSTEHTAKDTPSNSTEIIWIEGGTGLQRVSDRSTINSHDILMFSMFSSRHQGQRQRVDILNLSHPDSNLWKLSKIIEASRSLEKISKAFAYSIDIIFSIILINSVIYAILGGPWYRVMYITFTSVIMAGIGLFGLMYPPICDLEIRKIKLFSLRSIVVVAILMAIYSLIPILGGGDITSIASGLVFIIPFVPGFITKFDTDLNYMLTVISTFVICVVMLILMEI